MAMKRLSNVLTCWKNSLKVFKDFTYLKEHFQKIFSVFFVVVCGHRISGSCTGCIKKIKTKNKNTLKQLDLWKIAK